MKKFYNTIFLFALVLISACFFYPEHVFASLSTPYYSFGSTPAGTWSYDANTHALSLNFPTIGTSFYKDGTVGANDVVKGGTLSINNGVIYNGGTDSMVFGSQVGGTGSMAFKMYEVTNGVTTDYITATMSSFVVTKDSFGTRLDPNFDQHQINNMAINTGAGSKYLTDAGSFAVPVGDLYFQFTCSNGDCANNNFTANAAGTITAGKMSLSEATSVPVPPSALLFLSGGASLAFIRFRSIKKQLLA